MNVLAFVEGPDHVCYRYRIQAFEPTFKAIGGSIRAETLSPEIFPRIRQLMSAKAYEVTLVQRRLLAGWQLKILRNRARRLVFDFDDAVLYRDSHDRRGPKCPRRERRFRGMMTVADSILAGNSFLAECAVSHGANPNRVHVIPTCVSTNLYPRSPAANRRKDGLDLVWIGSSSTLQGLEGKSEYWQALGRRFPSLRLRLICDRFAEFSPLTTVQVPWSEASEISELGQGHIGMSWIPEDLWSRGKCGLKVIQYMAAGLPVIANPYGVHPEMILDGETGILARDASEWIEAIQWLSLYPTARAEIGQASRDRVEESYSVKAWAGRFLTSLTGSHQEIPQPTVVEQPIETPNAKRTSRRLDPPISERQPPPNSTARQPSSKKR